MTVEKKKKYILDKINLDSCYKQKSLETGYTIEQYLDTVKDVFTSDLSSKIYLLNTSCLVFTCSKMNFEEYLKLEEYIRFLILMYNHVVSLGLQFSENLSTLHQNKLNLWIVNSIYDS